MQSERPGAEGAREEKKPDVGEEQTVTGATDPSKDQADDEIEVEVDGSDAKGDEQSSDEGEIEAVEIEVADGAEADEQPEGPMSCLARAVLALQDKVKQERDRLLRAAADAENFRKRARRDQKDAVIRAEDKVVCGFLPVIDNLQRALAHADGAEDERARGLIDGVKMVHKQFLQTLERHGIRPFESLGQPFDPELHEAIQQIPSEHPANAVALELHPGYRRDNGRLVRPAMVAVSLGPAKAEGDAADSVDQEASGADAQEATVEDHPDGQDHPGAETEAGGTKTGGAEEVAPGGGAGATEPGEGEGDVVGSDDGSASEGKDT